MLPLEHGDARPRRGSRRPVPSSVVLAAVLASAAVIGGPALPHGTPVGIAPAAAHAAATKSSPADDASRSRSSSDAGSRSTAAADDAPADEAGAAERSRVAYYARQLLADPLYMSPSLVRLATPSQLAQLRREIRAMPYPTFVALVPNFDDEPGLETLDALPGLLRERMGRDGLYLVADGSGFTLEAGAFGVTTRGNVRRVAIVASDAVPRSDGPVGRLRFALRHLATGAPATRSNDAERDADDARVWWLFGGSILAGLLLPLGVAAATPKARDRRRARRAARATRPEPASSVAAAPDRAEARRQAQERTAQLARAVAEASDVPDRALRLYDAASTVLSRDRATPVDFVGADALATAGLAALEGKAWQPCFFDPRHGEGVRATRWRRGADDATLPACEACARAVRDGRAPASLPDRGQPYWERDGIWARTGFGAIDERVADVVLAGERRS